ncbi:MAG: mannose-1-phosphate guanylyltransferase/mannose-6-phosphate isomerase [Gammaproteobacteria bacterium]
MKTVFIPVILAGGSGTRLWPLSRQGYPKQFIDLLDDGHSLFQATVLRATAIQGAGDPIVICNQNNRFMVAEQLSDIAVAGRVILEPIARNTAPAIALAALQAQADGLDVPLLILPSDHSISPLEEFETAVHQAVDLAERGSIVTFGVQPTSPETGYGYIRVRDDAAVDKTVGKSVDKFVEKPDLATAQRYVQDGGYFWNSGMFVVKPTVYLEELQSQAEDIHEAVDAAFSERETDLDFIRVDAAQFERVRSDSIDYAVMERTERSMLVPLMAGWTDVGSWDAVADRLPKDDHNNARQGDVMLLSTRDCLVRAESRLVVAVGLSDTIVIETPDAVLVVDKTQGQAVKSVVEALKKAKRPECEHHTRVFRPWGWYESIAMCERFQAKRIMVKPGHALSLQKHHHRAEHWVVVKGSAEITRGDSVELFTEDQSTYIPLGTVHRLANPGLIPLEIIEVQTGSYLGEDDIVRLEDSYGRQPEKTA